MYEKGIKQNQNKSMETTFTIWELPLSIICIKLPRHFVWWLHLKEAPKKERIFLMLALLVEYIFLTTLQWGSE